MSTSRVLALLIAVLLAVGGTQESVARSQYRWSTDCQGVDCASPTGLAFPRPGRSDTQTGYPPPVTGRIGTIVVAGGVGTALTGYPASASWCAPTPTQCHGWGGGAHLAAVHSFTNGDRPYTVTVSRGKARTTVLVVSYCACQGRDDRIDLSPAAFTDLAPLSQGRINVVVSRENVVLPPTDAVQ